MFKPEDFEMALKLSSPMDMTEQAAYHIWATVVTATKAFGHVKVKIDSRNCRIYLGVSLRWWSRSKKFSLLHKAWLRRAEERLINVIPDGWRHLLYYEQDGDRVGFKGPRSDYEVDPGRAIRPTGGAPGGSRTAKRKTKKK